MRMPVFLPERLFDYQNAASEKDLFDALIKKRANLIIFFVTACGDETWCNTHSTFITDALQWFTEQFYLDNFHIDDAVIVANAIQRHYINLHDQLPLDFTFELFDKAIAVNSFLFQAVSPYVRTLIRTKCLPRKLKQLELMQMHSPDFKIVQEYIYRGEVVELFKLSEAEILKMIQIARIWQLPRFLEACERVLMRYVDGKRLLEFMQLAQANSLELISMRCASLMNQLNHHVSFQTLPGGFLACRAETSTVATREIVQTFSPYITHFIAERDVMEDLLFLTVLQQCPHLFSLDFGRAYLFTASMLEIPKCRELKLVGAPWLKDIHLKSFFSSYPQLRKLDLTNCTQITAIGWGELPQLTKLEALILARCSNVGDRELSVIIAAQRRLREIVLNDCASLSEAGFLALAKEGKSLGVVDLGRTALTDRALSELVSKIPTLTSLNISRCHFLTERGIIDVIKLSSLSEIFLEHTSITPAGLIELKTLKPQLIFGQES